MLVSLVVAGHLAGCRTPPAGDPVDTTPEDIPILWEQSGSDSPLQRSVRFVARTPADLALIPITEVPVDFSRQMVLLTALGPAPGREFGVRITRVWREGTRIRVEERQIHPGLDTGASLQRSSPWCMVVVPRSDLNVEGYSGRLPPGAWRRP